MSREEKASFLEHFSIIVDRRNRVKLRYPLEEIFLVTLCASICGAEDWVNVSAYGKAKIEFLKKFLPFKNGIASHDVFNDIFSWIKAGEFEECFINWTKSLGSVHLSKN